MKTLPTPVLIGCNDVTIPALVILQSSDRKSLAVVLDDAMFLGYIGTMPLLWDEARCCYVDLISATEVTVQWPT